MALDFGFPSSVLVRIFSATLLKTLEDAFVGDVAIGAGGLVVYEGLKITSSFNVGIPPEPDVGFIVSNDSLVFNVGF